MNIREFAESIGVSKSTVSLAIGGNGRISENKRKYVLDKMMELGFVPNSSARALATGKSNIIALVAEDPSMSYVRRFYSALEHELEKHGVALSAVSCRTEKAISRLENVPFDALVFMDYQSLLARSEFSILFNRAISDRCCCNIGSVPANEMDSVTVDYYSGGKRVLSAIRKTGAEKIIMACTNTMLKEAESRVRAYQDFVESEKLHPDFVSLGSNLETDEWFAQVRKSMDLYVRESGWPDAIYCSNDMIAITIMGFVQENGRVPGQDVLISGFDNMHEAAIVYPGISSVGTDYKALAAIAWGMITDRLKNKSLRPREVVLSPTVHLRSSTGPAV
jgi:DNA-binding LacI/PurR family transcriptional regulator